jgi:hypothetical protein
MCVETSQVNLDNLKTHRYEKTLRKTSIALAYKILEYAPVIGTKPARYGGVWLSLEWMCGQVDRLDNPEDVKISLLNLRYLGMVSYREVNGCYFVQVRMGEDTLNEIEARFKAKASENKPNQ